MQATLDLTLMHPSGHLATTVQGVWSAIAPSSNTQAIQKTLYSDTGSGFLFNFGAPVTFDGQLLPCGISALPNQKHASTITLPPSTRVAGIRFHPAVGYGVLGTLCNQATPITTSGPLYSALHTLFLNIQRTPDHQYHIKQITQWLEQHIPTHSTPNALGMALKHLNTNTTLGALSLNNPLSLRQIERLFKRYLGITPKYYQRIHRINKTILFLKANPKINLANTAQQFGFSDQAHMTREFQIIANTTPAQI